MEERLQKYMARCGIASRRKCEEIIEQGRVKVNANVITELGVKINFDIDDVYVDGILIKPEKNKIYIMLNKPVGYVSTVKDDKDRSTIMDLVKVDERIYPIGRLDYDSSGLLLLTNDGEVYNKVIHPREEVNKVYLALVIGKPDKRDIEIFCRGIDIGGYVTAPADFKIIKYINNNSLVKIIIHEGKNRQIRRMCESINHPVISLKRISIGCIELKKLEEGKWRFLDNEEVKYLKSL